MRDADLMIRHIKIIYYSYCCQDDMLTFDYPIKSFFYVIIHIRW